MLVIQFIQAHLVSVLSAALSISEALAFLCPNAGGILKLISSLRSLGVKNVEGK